MESNDRDDGSKRCDHCHQYISNANWVMHEPRCKRINVVCPECKEVVLRENMEGHREEYHTLERCELCTEPIQGWLMDRHKSEECWKRCIVCPFCKTEVSVEDFSEHEHACGSRTDLCYICHKYVMLKNMDNHLWEEHREGSGPAVPHNSPVPERRGGSGSDNTQGPHTAKVNTLFGRLSGGAPVPRKMGVSQPARKKEKTQAESNRDSLVQQFGQLSVNSREEYRSPPPLVKEGSPMPYNDRLSPELPPSAAPPRGTAEQQQQEKKNGEGEEEEDPNTIPCESCGKSIPIPDFMEHQNTCDPWAFLQTSPTPPGSDRSDWEEHQEPPLPVQSQIYTNSNTFGGRGNQLPSCEHLYGSGDNHRETTLCKACNQYIPSAQWPSHKSTCGSLLIPKKSSPPAPPVFEDAEDSVIPCQFCSQTFRPSDLLVHQERCMEDTQPFSQNSMSPWEPSNGNPLDTQDLLCDIPCEYCGSTVPASGLSEHQASCDHNPLVRDQRRTYGSKQRTKNTALAGRSDGGQRKCPYCHRSFLVPVFKNHKALCPKKPHTLQTKHTTVGSVLQRREEPLGETDRGCYYCGLAYPLEALRRHEMECVRNPQNTPSSRYEESHSYFSSDTLSGYNEGRRSPVMQPWLQEDESSSTLEGRGSLPGGDEGLPCEFCGERFAIGHVYSHQATCPKNPNLKVGPPPLEPMHSCEDDSSFTIPCEFCDKQLSFSQIHSHQAQCEVMSRKGTTQYGGEW